jgi:hypothetical protein
VEARLVVADTSPGAGRSAPSPSVVTPGVLSGWEPGMYLTVGAERTGDAHGKRAWAGTLHTIAVFDRALAAEDIAALHRDSLR